MTILWISSKIRLVVKQKTLKPFSTKKMAAGNMPIAEPHIGGCANSRLFNKRTTANQPIPIKIVGEILRIHLS